jgi:hypothetical protein
VDVLRHTSGGLKKIHDKYDYGRELFAKNQMNIYIYIYIFIYLYLVLANPMHHTRCSIVITRAELLPSPVFWHFVFYLQTRELTCCAVASIKLSFVFGFALLLTTNNCHHSHTAAFCFVLLTFIVSIHSATFNFITVFVWCFEVSPRLLG